MQIEPVDRNTYSNIIENPFHVFNHVDFNYLNAGKVENVHYLVFKDSRYRLGIILGEELNELRSPFSAPFGGFSFIKREVTLHQMEQALVSLQEWAIHKGMKSIRITLPPLLYQSSYLSKWINVFYRAEFQIFRTDLNYFLPLQWFDENYVSKIQRNARKNLKAAFKNDFQFIKCEKTEEKARAYKVIQGNRKAKGYPLRMSWEQVMMTIEVVPASFFLLLHQGNDVAAALIYEVSAQNVQVIYWGELVEYSQLRPMNYLSYSVFKYYKEQKKEIVDIGPSTENSVPNHGLCEFKESIGCQVDLKMTFSKSL